MHLVHVSKKQEFGTDVVRDIWGCFLARQAFPEATITCYWPDKFMGLDDAIKKQVATEVKPLSEAPDIEYDIPFKAVRRHWPELSEEVRQSTLDLSCYKEAPRVLGDEYVVLIPQLLDRYGKTRAAVGRSMFREEWEEIASLLRSAGYKIVLTGEEGATCIQKFDYDSFDHVYTRRTRKPGDCYLNEQLKILANAKCTIAMGGAALFTTAFGLPGVGLDPLFYDRDTGFFRRFTYDTDQITIRSRFKLKKRDIEAALSDQFEWTINALKELLSLK